MEAIAFLNKCDRTDPEPDTFIKALVKPILDRAGAIVVEIAGRVQFMTQRAEELYKSEL